MSAQESTVTPQEGLEAAKGESTSGSAAELARGKDPLLQVERLQVRFASGRGTVYAANSVDFTLAAGETVAIIGESGSGKTVTARALLGLLPNNASVSGSVRFEGKEILGLPERELREHRGADIAMIFQDSSRSLSPTMAVGRQIVEAVRSHSEISKKAAQERALELLSQVRVPAPKHRFYQYPHELSGGMRQRVMIAIALASDPRILIADEATTALDVTTQAIIMELLVEIQRSREMGLIVISHDMAIASGYSDKVIVMYGGRVVEEGPTQELFASVRMPYTKLLLAAVPRLDQEVHGRLPVAEGSAPDLTALRDGCAFASRCPYVQDRCRTETPPLERDRSGHRWACFFPLKEEDGSRD